MAESLRRLVNIGSFTVLQGKLETWLDDYYTNTCDENSARCCEIIELNAKVQGQLFKLLSLCAQEGGTSTIKSRLLPWLGQTFLTSGGAVTGDTSLAVLAEAAAKDRELSELQHRYQTSLTDLQTHVTSTQAENHDLKDELAETRMELERSLRSSSSDRMFTDLEVKELRRKLAKAQAEIAGLHVKHDLGNDYDSQLQTLREGLYHKSLSKPPPAAPLLPTLSDDVISSYGYKLGLTSPLSMDHQVQRIRQQNAIARFSHLFTQDRLDAMDTLQRYSDDHEKNQRIIFAALCEAFSAAKTAVRQVKMTARGGLAKTHCGPHTLEETLQDYINSNNGLPHIPRLVSDVIRALNHNSQISLPDDASYAVIQPFIREAVMLGWTMASLAHPLDISAATDAEVFDKSMYRRSYDSDCSAPLVGHHIWPALVQGTRVLVKGEVNTRRSASPLSHCSASPLSHRSASLPMPKRDRSPTRSLGPGLVWQPGSLSPSHCAGSRSSSPGLVWQPGSLSPSHRAGTCSSSPFQPLSPRRVI